MAYALFTGCNIPARLPVMETDLSAVLSALGVEASGLGRFACCGYPVRATDRLSWLVSAAANMALAEKKGLDMLVICQCCFGSFKNAAHALANDAELTARVNGVLASQGLSYKGGGRILHLFSLLHDEIGIEAIKRLVKKPFTGYAAASHTGCHALRPSKITEFDDPLNPKILDNLISALDAKSLPYPEKSECCGAPLTGSNDGLSQAIMARKLKSAKNAGAEFMVTGCPWCQIQFETFGSPKAGDALPPIPYIRLLGLAMGVLSDDDGLFTNRTCPVGTLAESPDSDFQAKGGQIVNKDTADRGDAHV